MDKEKDNNSYHKTNINCADLIYGNSAKSAENTNFLIKILLHI